MAGYPEKRQTGTDALMTPQPGLDSREFPKNMMTGQLGKEMKEIRIFLASLYELEPGQPWIGNLIRKLNEKYEEKVNHLKLVKWEDLDVFCNPASCTWVTF